MKRGIVWVALLAVVLGAILGSFCALSYCSSAEQKTLAGLQQELRLDRLEINSGNDSLRQATSTVTACHEVNFQLAAANAAHSQAANVVTVLYRAEPALPAVPVRLHGIQVAQIEFAGAKMAPFAVFTGKVTPISVGQHGAMTYSYLDGTTGQIIAGPQQW